MSDLNVRFLNKGEYERWDSIVAALPSASIFDESKWLAAVADVMGCDIRIAGVFEKDRLIGGVPLNISNKFGMPTATGSPLTPTNSCIAEPSGTIYASRATNYLLKITDAVGRFLQSNYDYAVVTNHPFISDIRSFNWLGWSTQVLYTYHIDLAKADFSALTPKIRKIIRKAEKSGVIIERSDDFSVAHDLLAMTFRRKGVSLPLSSWPLSQICLRCADNAVLFVAKTHDGKAIAFNIWIVDFKRRVAYALFSGFDYAYQDTEATSLRKWRCIEYFKSNGFAILDLVGAENKSIADFKAGFEGDLVPYYQVSKASMRYRILNQLSRLKPFRLFLR
ncbi:MAG: GNAT family N-acetyltransferase [Candidatus Brocadiaceae bacterium]|nr:GNAT family N-acetyltransferase [Candidatus Brocadiaceae bacterium]